MGIHSECLSKKKLRAGQVRSGPYQIPCDVRGLRFHTMHGTVEQIFMMMKPGMPGPGGAGRSLSCASSRLWRSPGSILLRACGAGLPGSWNRVCPGHAVRHAQGGLCWCACGLCSWHVLRFRCHQEFSARLRLPVSSIPRDFLPEVRLVAVSGGFAGESVPALPSFGLSRRFLAGVECCSSPGFWD